MKETHAFSNPKFAGQRIVVCADGKVLNSRTRAKLADANDVGSVAWYEFGGLVDRLNKDIPYTRPQRAAKAAAE